MDNVYTELYNQAISRKPRVTPSFCESQASDYQNWPYSTPVPGLRHREQLCIQHVDRTSLLTIFAHINNAKRVSFTYILYLHIR